MNYKNIQHTSVNSQLCYRLANCRDFGLKNRNLVADLNILVSRLRNLDRPRHSLIIGLYPNSDSIHLKTDSYHTSGTLISAGRMDPATGVGAG